jgi:hypothetical protein
VRAAGEGPNSKRYSSVTVLFVIRYQHEYLKEGYVYHAHTDRTTIEMYITKLKRLQERGNLNSAIDVESFADKYYVELQSYCMEKDIGDVSNELNDFAQRLLPFVLALRSHKHSLVPNVSL